MLQLNLLHPSSRSAKAHYASVVSKRRLRSVRAATTPLLCQIWSDKRLVLAQERKRPQQRLWIPYVCYKKRTPVCGTTAQTRCRRESCPGEANSHTLLLLCRARLRVCVLQSVSLRLLTDAESSSALQVKLAGPPPVRESKPLTTPCTDVYRDFGRGHRLYVGGVSEAVTPERVRRHFAKWGDVLDVYFPAARGFSKSNYCFVSFDSNDSAQQAYRESERSIDGWVSNLRIAVVHSCNAQSDVDPLSLLQPLKSINVAEDRKDDGHQASPLAGNVRSSSLATPASATLHMPHAADSESLPGYVSWLELQHQHAMRQLATTEATNVPAVHQYSAGLPHHGHKCSQYPCGPKIFPGGVGTNQVYWPAPVAHDNSLATTQPACVCHWNGMSFPLPGSLEECTQEMEGSVADLGSTDTSLSLDNLALLAHQSILEAFGHNFSGGKAVVRLMLILGHPSWVACLYATQ